MEESDLAAHSSPLSAEDLSEIAAYGATRSCAGNDPNVLGHHMIGLPSGPFNPMGGL